jgi:hypothetical protein
MINFKVVAWRREKKENEKNNKDGRDKKRPTLAVQPI